MEFRVVEEEYEAKLSPVAGQSATGKVERKRYRDGHDALRAKVRGLDGGATAAALELYIKGARVSSLDDNGRKAELELDSRNGASVPIVAPGDTVELHRDGRLLASGTFVID